MAGVSVLVISDSHGHVPALAAALGWVRGGGKNSVPPPPAFAGAIFLGDGAPDLSPASAEAGFTLPWYRVRGNGDLDFSIPDTLVLEIPGTGRRLFLAHGNRHGVETGSAAITAAARAAGAEAALFGHTHVPAYDDRGDILILNPGSIGRPRSRTGPSFAVLNCSPSEPLTARFFCLYAKGRETGVRELEWPRSR
ncbi:MAG: metallophosphoesterase family protein [Treponema sp.]|jgi:putative phosphoesterase|nr:metallophosphoesterase family protein [Treponema sp.]